MLSVTLFKMINSKNWRDSTKWPKSHGLLVIPMGWRELSGEIMTKRYTDFLICGDNYRCEPICITDWSNVPVSVLNKIGYKVIRQVALSERSETDLSKANWQ